MTLDDVMFEAEEKMEKAVTFTKSEFATIRTGKASPELVSNLQVEAYGSHMRLREMAAITTPDSRLIMIQPWDSSNVDPIRKAIEESKLGINPLVDGKIIRLPIPELSTERRVEMGKAAKKIAEEGRIAIRSLRRTAMDDIKKLQKDGKITEDDLKSSEAQVQKLTDQYAGDIDKALASKEAELLKV